MGLRVNIVYLLEESSGGVNIVYLLEESSGGYL